MGRSSDADLDEINGGRGRTIIRTVIAAISMFVIGSLMLFFGVRELTNDKERAISMIVVGSLAFLPGSYASFILYGACRGWPGYSYDQVPSYDD